MILESSSATLKPTQRIDLSGHWRCRGVDPADPDRSLECEATVPGHVHQDLLAAGIIKDPFWRDQALACQWVEEWPWSFEREFEIGPDFDLRKVVLECLGLDTYARVLLNGHDVGAAANMFVTHSWDVTSFLHTGTNRIRVEFTPHGQAVAHLPLDKYHSGFSRDRVFTRRIQCTFGWDWVHRFVSVGIWRSLSLRSVACGQWLDCAFRTLSVGPGQAVIEVEASAESPTPCETLARCELLDPEGRVVWHWEMPLAEFSGGNGSGRLECSRQVRLRDPLLWWPHGEGGQNLYTLKLRLLDADGAELDVREEQVGIRTIDLVREPAGDGETFVFAVNGRKIFARGANWVPADPFPSRITPGHYEHLIRLAKEGGFNMLRNWGGGIYEPEVFWRACNRQGILVIQDFLMACAHYPEEDPGFFAALRHEFEHAVRTLRNHPSLAMWAGSNELGMNAVAGDNFKGKRVCEEISRPLCETLDPTRPFLLTCPHTPETFREGPDGLRTNNWPKAGDSHRGVLYEPDFLLSDMKDYRARFAATDASFLSECPVLNAPPWHSLMKFLTAEDLEDPSGRMLEFRTKDNPYNDLQETHLQLLERIAATLFGGFRGVRDRIRKMEAVAWTAIRLTLEALRMKPERCGGVLFWMFNDCWPASGWSLVDYYGLPKAGFYGLKSGAAPVIGAFDITAGGVEDFKICNGTGDSADVHYVLRGFRSGEREGVELLSGEVGVAPRSCVSADRISDNWEEFDLLVLDTRSKHGRDRATFFAGLPAGFTFPPTHLRWEVVEDSPGQGEVRISTDVYAHMVSLEGEAIFDQNYFDLLPGEERVVRWRFHGDTSLPAVSECSCLNQATNPQP
jgi:beta-mannosidase